MITRALGPEGLSVPAVGLGGISLSGGYGGLDEDSSIATIHRAVELGAAFIDSADNYPEAHNERLVGRAIAGRRDRVTLATKVGLDISRRTEAQPFGAVDGRPEYVRAACERSLANLGVDHIDLYYQHRVDPSVPIEETVGTMGELVAEGKVRHLGLCEAGEESIARAVATHPISAIQCEWSLWSRDPEEEIVPAARRLGIGIVAYRPLGIGLLAGAFASPADLPHDDIRRMESRFDDRALERNLSIVDEVRRLARERGSTLAQVVLAWLLSRGEDVVAIPGTKDVGRLEENVAAADVRLTEADLERLESIAPRESWAGERLSHTG